MKVVIKFWRSPIQLLFHYVLAVLYVILATGLSSNLFSRFFQITGILASLVSISKACSEWHVYTGYNMNFEKKQVSPNFLTIIKAAFFFAPHIVFRTTSICFIAAFFKIYSIVPLAIFILISVGANICIRQSLTAIAAGIFWLPLSLFTPVVPAPYFKCERKILKVTMLTSTLIILPCLVLIRLLPLLDPETVVCTWGLHHLSLSSQPPSCSPCFNSTNVNSIFSGSHYAS